MKLNGCETPLNEPVLLKTFIESKGYRLDRVAAELNGSIVPKAAYETTTLTDNDVLEVVTFVGGG